MELRYIAGGAIVDATLFTDSLIGADQPNFWGDQYFCCQYQNGGENTTMTTFATMVARTAAGLTYTASGVGSASLRTMAIPRPLSFTQVYGQNQFAEITLVSDTSAGLADNTLGIAVFANTNGSFSYALHKNPQGTTAGIAIVRQTSGVDTLLGAIHAINPGDVMRLEVRRVGATNNLLAKINGVTVENQNDAVITPAGMPAHSVTTLFVGNQVTTFKNFSCGLLLN